MKKKIRFFSIGFFCLLYFTFLNNILIKAQTKPCGSYKINHEEIVKALNFERNNLNRPLSSSYLIRVYFHICKYTNGSHASATMQDLKNEFSILQSDYTGSGICFLNAGVDSINNTALDAINVDDGDAAKKLFEPYIIPNCVNIFYTSVIRGTNGANGGGIGGIALGGVPGIFCLISSGNINHGHTISHEIGHCLGLLHTFETAEGTEDIDESNCTTAGDFICDTKADPYSHYQETCFKTSGCIYTGTCKDPKGKTNYSPPYTNMMAYWWGNNCYSNLFFSPNQFTRMYSTLNTDSELKKCESSSSTLCCTYSNYSSGYVITSAVTSLTTVGNINFYGTVKATLGGQSVYLEPGFHAYPSSGGLVLIEASTCNSVSKNAIADNNLLSTISDLKKDSFDLVVYPNPTTSLIHIDFNTTENKHNIVLIVYNTKMQKVKEIKLGNLIKGVNKIAFNCSDLSQGVYLLEMNFGDSKVVRKIIKF